MSDWHGDTPDLAKPFCPGCQPDVDPSREIVRTEWCGMHIPDRAGLDDLLVPPTPEDPPEIDSGYLPTTGAILASGRVCRNAAIVLERRPP